MPPLRLMKSSRGSESGLVHRGVPHDAAPFAPGPLIGLGQISGASDDGSEGVFPIRHLQPTLIAEPDEPGQFPGLLPSTKQRGHRRR
jgi:hypothetical protein